MVTILYVCMCVCVCVCVAATLPSYRRSAIVRAAVSVAGSKGDSSSVDTVASSRDAPSVIVDKYLRRRGVFELLDADLVVEGMVCNKEANGLWLQIQQVYKIELRPTSLSSSRPLYKETLMSDLQDLLIEVGHRHRHRHRHHHHHPYPHHDHHRHHYHHLHLHLHRWCGVSRAFVLCLN